MSLRYPHYFPQSFFLFLGFYYFINQLGSSSAIPFFSFFLSFSFILYNLFYYILFTSTPYSILHPCSFFLFTPSLSMLLCPLLFLFLHSSPRVSVFGISVQYLCSYRSTPFSSRILLCVWYICAVFVFL